jgi:Holliday junction resolvasome RuvABC endonuclease subunit
VFLSADPGISNFGIAVIDPSANFKVIETHLVKNARKFTDEEKVVELQYGSRTVKVQAIIAKIKEFLAKYPTIDLVVVEAPFYSALTPTSYAALLEVIIAIKYEIVIQHQLKFGTIEPLLVKKLFTNHGMASKEAMRQFLVKKKDDKSIEIPYNIDDLSEHEIDAVAVGFVHHLKSTQTPPE